MANEVHAQNPLDLNDLYAAFEAADNIVLKKYIGKLADAPCIEMSDELKTIEVGGNVSLYRVAQIIYDKNENTQDKLTTVYSTIFSLDNCGLVMLVNGHKDSVDLFVGVVSRSMIAHLKDNGELDHLSPIDRTLSDNGKVLKNAFLSNFPGTELKPVNKITRGTDDPGKKDIISDAFKNAKYVSAVSSIPAIRNMNEVKNQEFIQGLEKLIESMRGKEYSAIIIADAMSNDKVETMCAEYEDIYAQLAPFKTSSQTVNTQSSVTDTEGLVKGVTDTTNETIAKSLTHGTATAKTHTDSGGGGVSVGVKPLGIGAGVSGHYEHAYSRTKSETNAEADTKSTGTAKSLTEQNSVTKALSTTNGESIQLNYENRAVKTLLDRIDEQIKRMRSCEDFGMFDTCAYFISKYYDVAVAAASVFKSITRGENSSVESSAVNVWKNEEDVGYIKDYLMRFYHPEFLTVIDEEHKYRTTAAMLVSGKEMAYQMALPKKSVAGVPVVECAEFGREVVTLSPNHGNIPLGKIYHMHKEEAGEVKLDAKSLASHTFITGSTGSGKSTTIYKLLDELSNVDVGDDDNSVKFMVIEPAKGEYKKALAKNKKYNVKVYGTNPNITKLLRINPFKFPNDKIHIYEHLDRLTEIFNVCWPMYAAMPAVLKAAMENAYRAAGWNLVKSENKHGNVFPSFIDVAIEVEKYINQSEYSDENKSNYKGSLLTRLESLTNGINSMIFSADDIDDHELFDENVIVDLSRVGSTETKALIMGILVLKLQEHRIACSAGSNSDLRHVTVLEEAHNLLRRTSTEQSSETANLLGKSVEMLANSIAEMRTYGEGFIIADQSPGLLDMSVIRNTNTKIIMRLPDFSDRELVGKAAGLNDDQIIELSKLPRGVAAVYQNDWISPVLCSVEKPKLIEEEFVEPTPYTEVQDEHLLFDLLDSKFRAKLDDLTAENAFREAIIKSSVPTDVKVKLLEYLSVKQSAAGIKVLASTIFDYFKNAKETLEKSAEEVSVEDLKTVIMAELTPSIMEYEDEQVNLLITLIIKEYTDRYYVDCPIWQEFVTCMAKGEII
jgi:DNA helicase HerA-like ATPase